MAESILKLKVDSEEYESRVKRAAEGIQHLGRSLAQAGKSFSDVDDKQMEFISQLGKMDTSATTTKQQLREISNALTNLTQTYRELTDEEKASKPGQELAKQIQILTERAGQAQDAMADVQASIRNAASDTRAFDQLSQGMSVATAGFQGLTGAGKLLGIEMGNDVQIIAKLQAAMAVTNSLTTIQNALQKESALMMGISAIKAKVLSGELTAVSIAQGALNTVMKAAPWALAVTAIYAAVTALDDFFDTTKDAEQAQKDFDIVLKKTAESLREIEDSANFDIAIATAVGKATGDLLTLRYEAAKTAEELAWNTMMAAPIGTEAYKTAKQQWEQSNDKYNNAFSDLLKYNITNQEIGRNWNTYNTEKSINAAISRFKELRSEVEIGSKAWDDYTKKITALESKLPKSASGGGHSGRGGGKGGGLTDALVPQYSVAGLAEDLKYLQQEQQKATSPEEWRTYEDAISAVNDEIKKLKGELSSLGTANTTGPFSSITSGVSISGILNEQLRKDQEAFQTKKLDVKIVKTPDKKEANATQEIGKMASGISSMVSGIESLGVEIPKGLKDVLSGIQGVISILTGISTIITAIEALTTADTIIPMARGGIVPHAAMGWVVPGNDHSDRTLIAASSGELILNQAEQGVVANALQNGGGGKVNIVGVLKGEDVVLMVDRWGKRTGKGELLFAKNL